ncbi:hypothetical protein EB001_18630 [bacterium]|nr:hypothetical protein [bacterium]
MSYKEYFNGKKIAIIGLGPHGEMIPDIKFLCKNKSSVTVFDMRTESRLKTIVPELSSTGIEKCILGKVDAEELLNFDLIIISPEISKKSIFLKKAIQAEIQVEFPDTLFFKLSPPVTLIGVMGQYGKNSVTMMIYEILKKSFSEYKDQGLFLINSETDSGVLSHLKKVKKDDVVLVRIQENLLNYYHEMHISPHVAVITSYVDFSILNFQTYNNFIVAPDEVVDMIKKEKDINSKAKILRTRPGMVPAGWKIENKISHHKDNIALAMQTCELFKVEQEEIREVIEDMPAQKGSVEFIKKIDFIEYYNDANSISPESTLSALKSLSNNRNTILILGGAYTGFDYTNMVKEISKYSKMIILLPGSGSLGIRPMLESLKDTVFVQSFSLEESLIKAKENAVKGDRILFSPAFDAVGIDISRKERGEKFVKIVRSL